MESFHKLKNASNLGLRMTALRRQIIDIFERSNSPISAPEIIRMVSAHKTSVYRELESLQAAQLIQTVNCGDGLIRYESADLKHHHHLICIKCRSINDVDINDDFSSEERKIKINNNFRVLRHNLEFFGICSSCN